MKKTLPIYDWDEIKRVADCADLMRGVLGMSEITPGRFNCPFRADSDSGAFAVNKDGWFDHVTKESGSALDLIARVKFGGDLFAASDFLGQHYNLESKATAKAKRHIVAEYIYTDEAGNAAHKTIRWEPKDFTQARWDGTEWKGGLQGAKTYLYKLPEVLAAKAAGRWIFLVEGEKDAETISGWGLAGTTVPMGAGKWRNDYTEYLRKANVCIVPDKDEAGKKHAELIARKLHGAAAKLKIMSLPEKDVTDWRDAGGTDEQFRALVLSAQDYTPRANGWHESTKEQAKERNEAPFANYTSTTETGPDGERRTVRNPIHINDLVTDIFARFLGFPRRVGETLFDHDKASGRIRYIESPQDLFAWIQEKSGQSAQWARIEGAVSQEQLFSSVRQNTRQYEMISGVPNWPPRSDVYYTHGKLPPANPNADALDKLLNYFCPATEKDRTILRAFFATPLYYRHKVDRPLWVIDATGGQGTGKTKLVELAAYLYGGDDLEQGEPIWADPAEVQNEQTLDRVKRRLLSRTGRKKRFFLIDNVTGYFSSPALASMVTQGSLSGIAPYGRGEETRPNDLTYVMTSNSALICRDLSARAFVITLDRPFMPCKNWEREIQAFILQNRMQVIADIIGLLERGPAFEFDPCTRFRTWEREVFAAVCGSMEVYSEVVKHNADVVSAADGEKEEAEQIRSAIVARIRDHGYDPEKDCVFLATEVLKAWALEEIPGFGGYSGRSIPHILRNWIKAGIIPELTTKITKLGHDRTRGLLWNPTGEKNPSSGFAICKKREVGP